MKKIVNFVLIGLLAACGQQQPGTGWLIRTPGQDSCFLLFSGIGNLSTGAVEIPQGAHPKSLYPGEKWGFDFKNRHYTLSADGTAKTIERGENFVVNYRLWLSMEDQTQRIQQRFVAKPSFDDAMIELLWVGDLDRDGKPDFIIDLSNHYNASDIGLFLSSGTAEGQLLRFIGRIFSVGC